jgi:hypothetical protein
MNVARNSLYGNGIQTQGLIYGGDSGPGNSNAAETYDGTSFTTSPATLATARRYIAGFGSGGGTTGVACGGFGPPTLAATEEFTSGPTTRTLTTS